MNFLRVVLIYLLVAGSIHARLGESERELIERFGEPTSRYFHAIYTQGKQIRLGPSMSFRQDDWGISCDLINGRCARIQYAKRGEWTEEQIQLVLAYNSQGVRWTEIPSGMPKSVRSWRRDDGAIAKWSFFGLNIDTPTYHRAVAVAEAKAKAEVSGKPRI